VPSLRSRRLGGWVDNDPTRPAGMFSSCRDLKEAVDDSVVTALRPIQARYADLRADSEGVRECRARVHKRAGVPAEAREPSGTPPTRPAVTHRSGRQIIL